MCTCESIPSLKLVGSLPAIAQACTAFTKAAAQPHVIQPKDSRQNHPHLSIRQRFTNATQPTYAESTKRRLRSGDRRFRRVLTTRLSADDLTFWLENKKIWVIKLVVVKRIMRNTNVNAFRENLIVNSHATGEDLAWQNRTDWGR